MTKLSSVLSTALLCLLLLTCGKEAQPLSNPGNKNNAATDSTGNTIHTKKVEVQRLILLNINDNHGEIRGFEKIAAYAQSLQQPGTLVLMVSGGDIFSGNGYVDQYRQNGVLQRGYPVVDLLNRMGFVALCLGNHDLDYGQTVLQTRRTQAQFPFLGANVAVGSSSALQPFVATHTLDTLGIKIAFVGTTQRNPLTKSSNKTGLKFSDPATALKQYRHLAGTHHVVIGMSHQGSDLDKTMLGDTALRYLHLLISSHDHRVVNSLGDNGVRYVEAGCDLQYVGKAIFNLDTAGRVKEQCSYENIALSSLSATDHAINTVVDGYENNAELNQSIGTLDKALSSKHQVGNLMTDALRFSPLAGADVAAINTGGVRESRIAAGEIIANFIYKADPFGNQMVAYTMTKTQLVNYIKSNYSRMYWSGIQVKREGKKVTEVYDAAGNELTKPEYTFGLNDYWTVSSSSYLRKTTTTATTAEILVNYIESKSSLRAADYATGRVNKK